MIIDKFTVEKGAFQGEASRKNAIYTVLINNRLWTNVVDDMNPTESWGWGGIIFLNKKSAKDFIKDLKRYDDEPCNYKIIRLFADKPCGMP